MSESTVYKVCSASSPTGAMLQKYFACGVSMAMRLWENIEPGQDQPTSARITRPSVTY